MGSMKNKMCQIRFRPGRGGASWAPPAGSREEPRLKTDLTHLKHHITHFYWHTQVHEPLPIITSSQCKILRLGLQRLVFRWLYRL